MPPPFHFDRTWTFDVAPATFWSTIERVDDYRRWWTWLREFEAAALAEGDHWRASVQSPLPYALRFTLDLVRIVPAKLLEARVGGDLAGPATLEVEAHPDGCAVRVAWDVQACSAPLRLGARVARPLLQWSHERVVSLGLWQFKRRALAGT